MSRYTLSPLHRRHNDDVINERLRQQQREQARAKRRADRKAIYAKPDRRDLYISVETESWLVWLKDNICFHVLHVVAFLVIFAYGMLGGF